MHGTRIALLALICVVTAPLGTVMAAETSRADEAKSPIVCLPDATGAGWRCERGSVPPRPRPSVSPPTPLPAEAPPTATSPLPEPDPAPNPEPNPGPGPAAADAPAVDRWSVSSDPEEWYQPTPARPVSETHALAPDLAARYFERAATTDSTGAQCSGFYRLREYPHPADADTSGMPVSAEADSLSAIVDGAATLTGNVTVEQGNRLLYAPSATLDQAAGVATFEAGARIDQPGLVMQGARVETSLNTNEANLDDVQFLLTDANIRGRSASVAQSGEGDLTLKGNEFTRCPPGNNGWRMDTDALVIEKDEVFGTARNAVVRLKSVPVFYAPYLKFPVSDERVSGFLFPNLSHSDEDGVDLSIPYYLNLAPNYDATLIPRVIGERGVGLEAEFRAKHRWHDTTFAAALLPEDDLFDGIFNREDWREAGGEAVLGPFEPADRWLGVIDHQGYVGPFRTLIDYSAASDADYFRDLGSDLALSSRRELERRGEIQYNQGGFFARVWAQRFQRLDDLSIEEYQRLPELEMTYRTGLVGPLEFSIGSKWSEFDRDTEGLNGLAAVTGSRVHVEPRLRLPFSWPFGFLTVGAGHRYTAYDLEQDRNAGGFQLADDSPDRSVGFGYVDGGLFFERSLDWFGQDLIQTLEPRLYYLYQEFEDQSELPIFDATALTFSYNQLFRDNRFSGIDRIGDADQLSAGLTTRFVSAANGREYFRASVGEIFYFRDRRVRVSGNPTEDDMRNSSALAGEISASLAGSWRVFGNIIWDHHDNEVEEGGGGIGYRRDNRHIFNLGFRHQRASNIEQTDVSLYWPLWGRFSVLGRWNYDLVSKRTIEGFGGLEYSDCCLQVRLMARRFLDSRTNDFAEVEGDDGIFLQIVFKGLAGFGTKVESVLERGIRGYRSPEPQDYFSN